jgi:predicted esterase YcpF (UPF0227 family)
MKILYVNGFKIKDKPSETFLKLKENLKNEEVKECRWVCKNGKIDYNSIVKCIEKEDPDLIVASSTGGLIASQLDIPQILINPVVDRNDLEELFSDCDFSNLPLKVSIQEYQTIIVGKNDEILIPNKTVEYFKGKKIIEVEDNHRLENKQVVLDAVKNYIKFIDNLTFVLEINDE